MRVKHSETLKSRKPRPGLAGYDSMMSLFANADGIVFCLSFDVPRRISSALHKGAPAHAHGSPRPHRSAREHAQANDPGTDPPSLAGQRRTHSGGGPPRYPSQDAPRSKPGLKKLDPNRPPRPHEPTPVESGRPRRTPRPPLRWPRTRRQSPFMH